MLGCTAPRRPASATSRIACAAISLGTGVRISEICPGRVETQLYRTAIGTEGAKAELYDGYEPIHPEDIAALVMAAINMPRNVDVSRIEVFPTSQAVGGSRMVKTRM